MNDMNDDSTKIGTNDARQGQTRTGARYVLIVSLALAVLGAFFLLGAFG